MNRIATASWGALAIALVMTSTAMTSITITSTALAQTPQTPDPKGCTPQERSNQALNQDSNKNAGVICPPDVDPAMKAPTPKTGDPSVIPPPAGGQAK